MLNRPSSNTTAQNSGSIQSLRVAALFVDPNGVYSGLPHVDVWGEDRDARRYTGPYPVVAHPPCQRWGRFADGSPNNPGRHVPGDDGGCFAAALRSIRLYGGVLEHPADSRAWRAFGIASPPRAGGWQMLADGCGGMTCHVDQGHYGHVARKSTWLYACGVSPPDLIWGPSPQRLHAGALAKGGYEYARKKGIVQMLSKKQRAATPAEFRDLLIRISLTAGQ